MKSFFEKVAQGPRGDRVSGPLDVQPVAHAVQQVPSRESRSLPTEPCARLAVYDSLTSMPRVIDLSAADCEEFANLLATRTYQLAQERGGRVPFTIIKEVLENLIHACFREAVVTILDDGNTIRIADQGPGIKEKGKAFEPGFSTATAEMKRFIKGVGSGLPIVRECLSLAGGDIRIEDNLETGTVVTLTVPRAPVAPSEKPDDPIPVPRLTNRQKKVLFLVTELGSAGPSRIARELRVALSTAYRDLTRLEEEGLVACDESGKRTLSAHGVQCLDAVLDA